jgi:hypothetical protein
MSKTFPGEFTLHRPANKKNRAKSGKILLRPAAKGHVTLLDGFEKYAISKRGDGEIPIAERRAIMEDIIVALITGGLSLMGVMISNWAAHRKTELTITTAQAVTDTKITALTREVREHNNFARRVPVMEEQIKVMNHRIKDLEGKQ